MSEKSKKRFKIFLIISVPILIVYIIWANFGFVIYLMLQPRAITKDAMEQEFVENREMILEVVEFFEEQEWETITIWKTHYEGDMFVYGVPGKSSYVPIENQHIAEVITLLFEEYNFTIISKEVDEVYFQRWADLDTGRGVVYSPNGEPTEDEFITILEPLQEEGWYFYEDE